MTDEPTDRPQNLPATWEDRTLPVETRAERFAAAVFNPRTLDIAAKAMPSHIDPERFKRNLTVAIVAHPKLLECEPAAVFHEAGKISALGLYMDPALGEAYLITGWDKRRGGNHPQARLGYRGLLKLARQSGTIRKVYAHPVYAEEMKAGRFKATLGVDKTLTHEPVPFATPEELGEIVGVYAVVHYTSGDYDFAMMSRAAVDRIRDRADSYKSWVNRDANSKAPPPPWVQDYEEMALKTVLRRLMKTQPTSPELVEAFAIEDRDYVDTDGVVVERPRRLTPAEMLRQRKLASNGPGFDTAHVDRELNGAPAQLAPGKPQGAQEAGEATTPTADPARAAQAQLDRPCINCGATAGEACKPGCGTGVEASTEADLSQPCGECGAAAGEPCADDCQGESDEDETDSEREPAVEVEFTDAATHFAETAEKALAGDPEALEALTGAGEAALEESKALAAEIVAGAHDTALFGPEAAAALKAAEEQAAGAQTADDFPGDRKDLPVPSNPSAKSDEAPADKPKPTLSERAKTYEDRMKASPSSVVLKRLGGAAKDLLKELDRSDPERKVELDKLFIAKLNEHETTEREGR